MSMPCIYCDSDQTMVWESRPVGKMIKRRRKCNSCGKTFVTWEEPDKECERRAKLAKRTTRYDKIQHMTMEQIEDLLTRFSGRCQGTQCRDCPLSCKAGCGAMNIKAWLTEEV